MKILLRADSGFARDGLMTWCEGNRTGYVFGLARNERLVVSSDIGGPSSPRRPKRRWRRLNGPDHLGQLIEGIKFHFMAR